LKKEEIKVEAAEVIMIKLITNKITTPNAFPTSKAAFQLHFGVFKQNIQTPKLPQKFSSHFR
jgi:hypothetical protein